jgi:hypothetical protein
MVSTSYLTAIEAGLAKVMAKSYQDDTFSWNACEVVLQHAVKHLERVHHETLMALVMRIASRTRSIVAILNKLDEVVDSFAVYFRKEGDDTVFHSHCVHVSLSLSFLCIYSRI